LLVLRSEEPFMLTHESGKAKEEALFEMFATGEALAPEDTLLRLHICAQKAVVFTSLPAPIKGVTDPGAEEVTGTSSGGGTYTR
jgi:hypothetical protein